MCRDIDKELEAMEKAAVDMQTPSACTVVKFFWQ